MPRRKKTEEVQAQQEVPQGQLAHRVQADGRLVRRRGGAAAARKQRKRKQQAKDFCDVFHVVSPFYMGTSRPFRGGAARFRLCMIASLSVFFNSFSSKQRFFKKEA